MSLLSPAVEDGWKLPTSSTPTLHESSTSARKQREYTYSEERWPRRKQAGDANVIIASAHNVWASVESIQIGDHTYTYLESEAQYTLTLSHGVFQLKYGSSEFNLPCTSPEEDSSFIRAKLLYSKVWEVPNLSHDAKLKIVERERPGRQANSDSDDECIPDPPIQPSFSQSDLAVVQFYFHQLCQLYPIVLEIGFFNALGKILFFTGSQFSAMYVKGTNAFSNTCVVHELTWPHDSSRGLQQQ